MNERYNNNENDDVLVVQYISNNENDDNSYDIDIDNNINDSSDINKTESNIEDEIKGEDGKKLGISIHNIHKKKDQDKEIKFEKDNDLDDIDYKTYTLNLEENKKRRNQRNISVNQLNKSIKINRPEKKNSNLLYPKTKKVSFNAPRFQYSCKSMIQRVHNFNKTLNINHIISLDNENEIIIESNKDKEKMKNIETIITADEDINIHFIRKKNMKNL